MTDLTPHDAPAAAPAMPSLPALNEGQVASAREHWISLGLDATKFDAAASGAAPEPQSPQPSTDQRPNAAGMDPLNLSAAQRAEMANALLAAGAPKEAVEAAMKADGAEMPGAPSAPLTEEEKVLQSLAPAAPTDIKVDYMGRISPDVPIEQLVELNQAATTWASEIGFPAVLGAAVIERALDVGHAYDRMDDISRQPWVREQRVEFERMAGGPEKAAEKMALAAVALQRGTPAFTQGLKTSGALHDAGWSCNWPIRESGLQR
jgi:hypothetical protein